MYLFIVATVWRFFGREHERAWLILFFNLPVRLIAVTLQTVAISAVLAFSALQILRLLGVEDINQFVCLLNDYLSETDYSFTPERPEHCEALTDRQQPGAEETPTDAENG